MYPLHYYTAVQPMDYIKAQNPKRSNDLKSAGLCQVNLSLTKEKLVQDLVKSNHVFISHSSPLLRSKKNPLIMSSNNSADSPTGSLDSGGTSFWQQILISFIPLSFLFIILYAIRWFLQRTARRRALLIQKRNTGGLDLAAIAALPTFPYRRCADNNKDGEEHNGSSMECSICLNGVEEGEMVKLLPECTHSFHGDCVELWLRGHTTCPICRIEVLGSTRVVHQPSRVEVVPVPDLERQQ